MSRVSSITKSPIAQYLIENKPVFVKDKNILHFISKDGLYLGNLTKQIVNNYKVISLNILGEGLKKMYIKSVAYGQQFAYVKNASAPIGVSIIPVKTYMRKIFVDFINGTKELVDTEKNLSNKLDLVALDENTGVGLYDTEKPFLYSETIKLKNDEKLKHPIFRFIRH